MQNGLLDLADEATGLLQQANEAAGREDWDTAVEKLRQAMKIAGARPPDVLKKNLAASLANRAVKKANRAVEVLGNAGKAHQDMVSSLTSKIRNHYGLNDCALCGKSKYSASGDAWFTVTLAGGTTAELCGRCTAQLRALQENTPEPDPGAVALLRAANADLTEAAALDPSSEYVKKNRDALADLLSKMPGDIAKSSSPAAKQPPSPPKQPRKASSTAKSTTSDTSIGQKIGKILAATWWIWIWVLIWLFSKGCN
jgi:hypothetical protein